MVTKVNTSQFKSGILSQDLDIQLQDTTSYFAVNYSDAVPAIYVQDNTTDSVALGSKSGNELLVVNDSGVDVYNSGGLALSFISDGIRFYDTDASNYAFIKAPGTLSANYTLVLPADDGTPDQVLKTDGSGNLSWVTQTSGVTDHGALTGLSDDDHTQYALLAGRGSNQTLNGGTTAGGGLILDSTSNATKGSILLNPSGGDVHIGGGSVRSYLYLYEDSGSGGNKIGLRAPTGMSADYSLTLPTTDGLIGQVLTTDGSGTLTWEDAVSGSSSSGSAGAVQISNGSGGFTAEEANFFYNTTTNQVLIANSTAGNYNLQVTSDNGGIQISPVTSGLTGALNAINVTGSATGNLNIGVTNSNAGSGANSRLSLNTASGAGDPFILFNVGDTGYIAGIDNSDSDTFRIGIGSNPSSMTSNSINIRGNKVGVSGQTSPTAALHLPAGTASAETAPLKFTTGTAMTTPEDGALEYHSSHLYFTIGSTRYQLDQQVAGGGTPIVQNGNSLGAAMTIGTNDTFGLNLETNGTTRISVSSAGEIDLGQAAAQRILLRTTASSTSGGVEISSTSTTSTTDVAAKFTGPAYTASSNDNKTVQITNSYTRSSGASGLVTTLAINPTVNLSGSAGGGVVGVDVTPTLTSLTGNFYGIYLNFSNANAFGIFQSGSSTLNVLNGKTAIGSTTSPTESLNVTGNAVVAGQYVSTAFSITDGAGFAVNWNNGNVQYVTIQANRTPTFSNPKEGGRYILIITQGTGGSKLITWPTIKWRGGTAPTLTTTAGKADIITFVYANGSYYGDVSLNY